jgi:hypothetical protein
LPQHSETIAPWPRAFKHHSPLAAQTCRPKLLIPSPRRENLKEARSDGIQRLVNKEQGENHGLHPAT